MIPSQQAFKRPMQRKRSYGPCFLGIVFPLLIVVSSAAFTTASHAQQPTRIRVLSYNIHHAQGTDGKLDLERIASVIKADSMAMPS